MNMQREQLEKAGKRLAAERCHTILWLDLTADCYEVLKAGDPGEDAGTAKTSGRIGEWFGRLTENPLCQEDDRERIRTFAKPEALRKAYTDRQKSGIVYRRKFTDRDRTYRTVLMELMPFLSEEGHQTAILFERDITEEIRSYDASLEENRRAHGQIHGKRTVLIVDDNELNRDMLEAILEADYQVLKAENGAVGLELLQKNMIEIAVVMLDVQMPVMNGYEFLESVRPDPLLSKIPIIVATGSDNAEEEGKCLKLGASDFVEKPYNPEIIRSRIANIIRLKESAATMTVLQTDERTGLYNLQAFCYYAGRILKESPEKNFSITIFDIDHFKRINVNYGEEAGDQLLREAAGVIKGYTSASEINGRFGAARFLVLREEDPQTDTETWIGGLFKNLKDACSLKGISFKAGIYDHVDKSLPVSAICDRAIMALNSAGASFQNQYALYDEAHAERERRLAVMEADMKEALDDGQFAVYYQPKHDAMTGKLVGAEALIRWIHPDLGFLPPGEFVPLFEKNGFVSYADFYALRRTCANIRAWKEEGLEVVPISVNASRRDFDHDDYEEILKRPLAEYGVDPSMIHIEVTETVFSENLDGICRMLKKCRDDGFQVEMDDFGTGYSSLTTLAALPLDILKLDMSFMRNYKDDRSLKILSVCIGLAKSLGLKTVCEGVETEEQVKLLKKYDCDMIQGYYYSKPLPEEQFREYLKKYSR